MSEVFAALEDAIANGEIDAVDFTLEQPKLEDVRTLSDDGRFSVWAARKKAKGGGEGKAKAKAGKRKRE